VNTPDDVARPGTPLTPAERRALDAYAQHGTTKAAAAAIGRSPKTVEHQLATARTRLGVSATHQAIVRSRS
jgi:DNA-binding CsgD family transcriptional regulator